MHSDWYLATWPMLSGLLSLVTLLADKQFCKNCTCIVFGFHWIISDKKWIMSCSTSIMYGIMFSFRCTSRLLVLQGLKLVNLHMFRTPYSCLNCWYLQISLIGTSGISGSYVELRAWREVCRSEPWNHQWAKKTCRSERVHLFPFFFLCSYHGNNNNFKQLCTWSNSGWSSLCRCNKIVFLNVQIFFSWACAWKFETCRFCSFFTMRLTSVQPVSIISWNEVCIDTPLPLYLQLESEKQQQPFGLDCVYAFV